MFVFIRRKWLFINKSLMENMARYIFRLGKFAQVPMEDIWIPSIGVMFISILFSLLISIENIVVAC